MIRLTLVAVCAGVLLCGCGRTDGVAGDQAAAQGANAAGPMPTGEAPADDQNVKTPLIRALLQTIDESKGESSEVKDSLKRSLREADRDLADVLGGKSKQLIMKANQKPPTLVIGEPSRPATKPKPAKTGPSEKAGADTPKGSGLKKPAGVVPEATPPASPAPSAPQPAATGDQDLKTPMVRSLMQAVDDAQGDTEQVKDELKRLLRQADQELSEVLGGKSQELILKANQKPPVPAVGSPGPQGARVRSVNGVKVLEFPPSAPK